jgi:hypothetical protein
VTTRQEILDFYSQPGAITSAGKYADLLERLPHDVGSLVRIDQALVIHEFVASSFYGVTVPEQRKSESHIRPVESMLERIVALDDRPLAEPRPPERRLAGVCRHYMTLLLAMLRAQRIPARGRCGFGARFNPGYFEDHVLCEYWNAAEERWVMVDPQLDDVWRTRLGISQDVLSVPPVWFVTAADAWTQCRAGQADPKKFGIFRGDLRGLWFLAVNLIHEVALLNKMEPLRWDVWGAMPPPNEALNDDQLAFFDELAALTRNPDESFEELRRLYERDDRVRVPETVFNVLLNRPEKVAA